MDTSRTVVEVGGRLLTEWGTGLVTAVSAAGVDLRTSVGDSLHVDWPELAEVRVVVDGDVAPIRPALRPYWDGLSEETRRAALDKLEIVQEILTGYRDGHAELAREVAGDIDMTVEPMMGGEDFSYMLEQRPGAYIFVGNGDTARLHHPAYDFDDDVIPAGSSWYAGMIEARMPAA